MTQTIARVGARKTPRETPVQERIPQRRGGETQERPRCDCTTGPTFLFTATGAPAPEAGMRFRYRVGVSSTVTCDPGTPGQCEYRYSAECEVQQQRQAGNNRRWERAANRNGFLQSFKVHDDVNQTVVPDRIDQTSLEIAFWRPKAPVKETTRVTIVIAPSIRGGIKATLEEDVELCLPKGPVPQCP